MMPIRIAAAVVLAAVAPLAPAQQKNADAGARKLYCWEQDGQRVCSDALPQEAVDRAREEISLRSGLRTGEVQRALTEEERAALAQEEAQRRAAAAVEETRRRTEQAMLASFQSEDELRRVFSDRASLVENNVRTARYNVASLHDALVALLRRAGERELAGKPVPDKLAGEIRQRHAELAYQRHMQRSFEQQRAALDAEIEATLQRYRELKGPPRPGAGG